MSTSQSDDKLCKNTKRAQDNDWMLKTIIALNLTVIVGLLKFVYDFNRAVVLVDETPTRKTMEWVRTVIKTDAPWVSDKFIIDMKFLHLEGRVTHLEKKVEQLDENQRQLERKLK